MSVALPEISEISALYDRGLYLQAYEQSKALGPLGQWRGGRQRVLAGRLAANLGGRKQGYALHLRAWREEPHDPQTRYFYSYVVVLRRGPVVGWKLLDKLGDPAEASGADQADWFAMRARVAAMLRDFEMAWRWIERAESIDPGRPWTWIERCAVLELEDRYDEALEAAEQAFRLRPWYRPAVQAMAQALEFLSRDRRALDILVEATHRLESGDVVAQLANLQMELGHHADARRNLERLPELFPLMEKEVAEWLAGRRSDAAYFDGDLAAATELARSAPNHFFQQVAEHLRSAPATARRVLLDVGFVRQHHVTCAPATLSAISRFFSHEAEHLSVAERICYDGTPAHSERGWAEQNGFFAREFTVTWSSAVALLDRGIPFTLTTNETDSAHLQAVIGYDERRGTLIVRDPNMRHANEFLVGPLLERYRSSGPRGMLMVPRGQSALVQDIELLDAERYDDFYELQCALEVHDRAPAQRAHDRMRAAAPLHRLTLHGRRSLAAYDDDVTNGLHAVEALLSQFPDDGNLLLSKVAALRQLVRREDRLALLKEVCARSPAEPVFWQQYAQELSDDGRQHAEAVRLLGKALRLRPQDARCHSTLANVLWAAGRRDESLWHYRVATCLNDKDEGLAKAYFLASRHMKQTDRSMKLLEARFSRLGGRSGQPAMTLFWAQGELDLMVQAFETLDKALALRAGDGQLLLFAADAHGRCGRYQRAGELLAQAKGRCHANAWRRTAAELAMYQGDRCGALAQWREVIGSEPLAVDAHRAVARLLAETEGPPAALAHLKQVCHRHTHHVPLWQLWIEWLRSEGQGGHELESAVRTLLDVHPVDPWARRELALVLADQLRFTEAFAELDLADPLEPGSSTCWSIRGLLLARVGRRGEAKDAFREAIRLSVDNQQAQAGLLDACQNPEQRRAELEFIRGELVGQTTFGDGLLAYREQARGMLDDEAILAVLREGLAARPDLWHAWSAIVHQLMDMSQLEKAFQFARQAVRRFSLLPATWLDLAVVERARGRPTDELEALEQALRINPAWPLAVRQLAELHERQGQPDKASSLLQKAIARNPLDATLHGSLADVQRKMGDIPSALDSLERAVRVEPGYDWAWSALADWSIEAGRSNAARDLARDVAARRPREARSWLVLAKVLSEPDDLAERLSAIEQALALNPRLVEAHDLKARLLAEQGQFDEALAACRGELWGHDIPVELAGREAWILAEQGGLQQAIARLRPVVAEYPNYFWAWQRLAEWHDLSGDSQEYLAAADQMVRCGPNELVSWGYRGEARLKSGDRAGAIADFQRAAQLAPDYVFAQVRLFDLYVEGKKLDAARAVLAEAKKHARDEHILAREVQLAAHWCEMAAARVALEALCVLEGCAEETLRGAVAEVEKQGWYALAETTLSAALARPGGHPAAAAVLIQHYAHCTRWTDCGNLLRSLEGRGENWVRACEVFFEAASQAGQASIVRAYVRQCRRALRAETRPWGAVGHAFTELRRYGAAIRWMTDWNERDGVQPWMLFALALARRYRGQDAKALRLHRRALELPADHTTALHWLWLAAHDEAGPPAEVLERLDGMNTEMFTEYYRCLHRLVRAASEVQMASGDQRLSFRQARKTIRAATAGDRELIQHDWALRRRYHGRLARLAWDRRRILLAAWHWLQTGNQLSEAH